MSARPVWQSRSRVHPNFATVCALSIWPRSLNPGSSQPRLRAPWVCPISRAVQPWIVFADSSAIAACSWCWTTVNIFSMRAQRWSLSYWGLSELTILATSREPIGMAGEITWRVPSMSITDEAVELFADRASRVQPGFTIANHNAAAVGEICRRLDGIPLAIEFAAARVRSMSPLEIADGLDDCFRLLAGGVRGAVQRQQTLRASIDWSHALLTETEQILFRRLAPFVGGFDLAAVRAVAAGSDLDPFSVLDQLTLLVDKSLVVADDCQGRTRYRLLETVRRYALEKLGDSGEADVHARHRDYYTALAASLNTPADNDHQRLVARAETEIDNLRAAFAWSRENGHITEALQLASSLQPIWFGRAHLREGLSWFNSILEDQRFHRLAVSTAVRARALADKAMLSTWLATSPVGATDIIAPAQQALAMAREVGDPAALVRALTACGCSSGYNAEAAAPYFAEATDLARAIDDKWTLCQILYWRGWGPAYQVTRMLCEPRQKNAATWPTPSATGSSHVTAACGLVWRRCGLAI